MTNQQPTPPTKRDPDLLTRLWHDLVLTFHLLTDRRVSASAKLIPLLAVVYILSPIDFIPDMLLPFGVVDDLGVFLLGLQMFIRSAPPEVVDQHRGIQRHRAPGTQAPPDGTYPDVIEGQFQVLDAGWDNYDEYEDEYGASGTNSHERR